MTSNTLRALFIVPTCVALGAAGCSGGGGDQSTGGTGGSAPAAGVGGVMAAGTGGAMTGGTGGSVAGTGGTTGGMAGAATTGGTGGMPTGGSAGMPTGGSAGVPMGGSAGVSTGGATTGGAAGSGAGSGGSGGNATCTITPTSEISSKIATVGIVTFTTDLAGVTEAHIDFGLDTNYGMTAPVDLAEPSYRTLLLGMKPSREYHYRIAVTGPGGTCMGADNTIMTSAEASNLPSIDIEVAQQAKLAGGFIMTAQYQGSNGNAPVYIIDADGDFVWWYSVAPQMTGARMSYDGKHMWVQNANVPDTMANVHRVSMDGLMDENLSSQFTGANHQLTVLPDETVAFYAYNNQSGCDDIKERSPAGMVKTIINSGTAHGAGGPCHVNAIEYSPEDDTLVFSDLDNDNYTKVTRDGDVVWVLGGSTSDFTGMGASWSRQHGVHILGLDRFLIFNNGSGGGGSGSVAIEILLDLGGMTATRAWSYTAMPAINNIVMGDVQRLPNDNTIVAYSTQGVLHEVDAEGQLVREITWPIGGAYGYIQWRPTLYGPPER